MVEPDALVRNRREELTADSESLLARPRPVVHPPSDDPDPVLEAGTALSARGLSTNQPAASASPAFGFIKRNNMELQFWGYEIGNVLATIAGAGGFLSFQSAIQHVLSEQSTGAFLAVHTLLTLYPDAAVTLGLGSLVVVVPVIRARFSASHHLRALNAIDLATTIAALVILCYSLLLETSWIAVASSCFVVASCLLRQSRSNPLLLKAGGLGLTIGGIGLAVFGLQIASSASTGENDRIMLMGGLTVATGIYVSLAGFLTYEGGIFATREFISQEGRRADGAWAARLAHPVSGLLARHLFTRLDEPIISMNQRLSRPAIFWASDFTRENRPFKTSMLARLPWRVMTGVAGLLSMTPAGFAFFTANLCWAIGDVAIGSEDW